MEHDMLQIGMPDSNAFKTGPGCGFYSVFEIIGAYFTGTWKYSLRLSRTDSSVLHWGS